MGRGRRSWWPSGCRVASSSQRPHGRRIGFDRFDEPSPDTIISDIEHLPTPSKGAADWVAGR
jgi:hypothetical protein